MCAGGRCSLFLPVNGNGLLVLAAFAEEARAAIVEHVERGHDVFIERRRFFEGIDRRLELVDVIALVRITSTELSDLRVFTLKDARVLIDDFLAQAQVVPQVQDQHDSDDEAEHCENGEESMHEAFLPKAK